MTHSLRIFGKEVNQLTFSDVQNFFRRTREEHLNLEFKSNPSLPEQQSYKDEREKLHDVIKNICAMLNAEGGIIIWGAPIETKNKAGKKEAIGDLTAFRTKLNRDSFMNTVNDYVTPLAVGVRVKFLEDLSNPDFFIAVIEVEKSLNKPHQCKNVYYIRLDGQTRPAPHYLIRALMTSTDYPVIYGSMRLREVRQTERNELILTFKAVVYNGSPFNNELNAWVKLHNEGDGVYFVSGQNYGIEYDHNIPFLTNGRPYVFDFSITYPITKLNQDINLGLSFGGEKSPTKRSLYLYNINDVTDDFIVIDDDYLIEKHENILAEDISTGSIEQRIEILLKN